MWISTAQPLNVENQFYRSFKFAKFAAPSIHSNRFYRFIFIECENRCAHHTILVGAFYFINSEQKIVFYRYSINGILKRQWQWYLATKAFSAHKIYSIKCLFAIDFFLMTISCALVFNIFIFIFLSHEHSIRNSSSVFHINVLSGNKSFQWIGRYKCVRNERARSRTHTHKSSLILGRFFS